MANKGTYYEVKERPKITITPGNKEESLGIYNRKLYNGKWSWGQYDNNGNFTPITKEVHLKDGTILNVNGSKSSEKVRNAVKNAKITERGYIDNLGNKSIIKTNNSQVSTQKQYSPRKSITINAPDWGAKWNTFYEGLTDDQKRYMTDNGIDYSSVGKLQQYLADNNYYTKTVDNKWGDNSQRAWDAFAATIPVQQKAASVTNISGTPTTTQLQNIVSPVTYNRSDIRQQLSDMGYNPYSFTGAQRRAYRMVQNGTATDNDRRIVAQMNLQPTTTTTPSVATPTYRSTLNLPDYVQQFRNWAQQNTLFKRYKNGGLVSRNPIKRFKQR